MLTASAGSRRLGLLLALVSAFTFGASGPAAKPLIEAGLAPLEVTWLRVAGAALVLLPLGWRHRALLRQRPALLLGFGTFAVAGVQACYFAALSRIPVGVALLIEYLAPALVLGWVRFVQRRPVSRASAVGVVFAVGGLACVVEIWSGMRFDVVGLGLALGAAGCQACYFLLSEQGSRQPAQPTESPAEGVETTGEVGELGDERPVPHPLGVIAYGTLVGAVLLTLLAQPWRLEWGVLVGTVAVDGSPVPGVVLVAWIVLVSTVFAYVAGVVSVRRLSPPVAGVIGCLEAVVATVLAWVVLGERLAWVQLLGGAVVLLGAVIAQAPGRPRAARRGGPGASEGVVADSGELPAR